ncbi:TPA: DUF551 domain-containing protein, partial [Enterobacter roggenkampii]
MSTITKGQLIERAREKVKSLEFAVTQTAFADSRAELEGELELARIALASLEAEAVGEVIEQQSGMMLDGLVISEKPTYRNIKGIHKMKMMPLGTKFYTAPPAPANAEPVAWLWSHRKHPREVTLVRPEDDERAEGAHWSGWSCQALYAAPPAPAAMKDHQIRELVNELRDIAVEYHGTQQLRERIARTIRAAMLQGTDGNSPDGWVACSERMPETMVSVLVTGTWFHHAVAFWDGFSWCDLDFEQPVTHWMPLPAAPQQEVK